MNLFKKLTPLAVVLLLGCSQSKPTRENKPITFASYIKSLDTIPLPFTGACNGHSFPILSNHFDSVGFARYKDPNCTRPLGILYRDKANTVLVDISIGDDCLVPFLVSFDSTGKKIDSLDLYENAGQDSDMMTKPYFKIARHNRIVIIDTISRWKLDTAENIIPSSKSVKIDSTIYHVSEQGKFISENGRPHR